MQFARAPLPAFAVLALTAGLGAGCTHPAYGPSSDARLEQAVRESGTADPSPHVTVDDLVAKKCVGYQDALAKAHNDERPEVDRMQVFVDLYKDLKGRNAFIDEALARNPDLQYHGDARVPKIREDCVQALADVRSEFYRFLADVTELLVVQDVHGRPVARLDLAKVREAIAVLDPEDRDNLLGKVDAAERRLASKKRGNSD